MSRCGAHPWILSDCHVWALLPQCGNVLVNCTDSRCSLCRPSVPAVPWHILSLCYKVQSITTHAQVSTSVRCTTWVHYLCASPSGYLTTSPSQLPALDRVSFISLKLRLRLCLQKLLRLRLFSQSILFSSSHFTVPTNALISTNVKRFCNRRQVLFSSTVSVCPNPLVPAAPSTCYFLLLPEILSSHV